MVNAQITSLPFKEIVSVTATSNTDKQTLAINPLLS